MPGYDGVGFDPPAPVAEVTLQIPANGASIGGVRMLIDTGADVTLVPAAALRGIGVTARPGVAFLIESFDGETSHVPVAALGMLLCGRSFRGEFLVIEQESGILGRNVLNQVQLLLDGPDLTWTLTTRSPLP